jgi:serine/threonine protein kinase
LAYLHTQEPPLVHQDIKPSNLIWGDDGQIHLIDFGAAQVMGREGHTLTVAGTFGYMAPEQLIGRATPASDLYSLGATLVQLLTGQSPRELTGSPGSLDLPQHGSLTGWLRYWLERMLAPDLKYRFASALQALAAFEKKQEGILVSDEPPLSSVQRFIVEECSEERLQVTLSLNSDRLFAQYRFKEFIVIILVSFGCFLTYATWESSHIFGSLVAGCIGTFGFIWAISVLCLVQCKNLITIKNGHCFFLVHF